MRDRVAIVTGGGRGLGRAIATAMATAGAQVVIASRRLEACQQAAREITELTGMPVLPLRYHAGEWTDSDRLADSVMERFGRIDVLVNNAGMSPPYHTLGEVSEELFDKVIAVNLRGPFRLSTVVAERMMSGEGGSIINVSSIAAVDPRPSELPYAAAKAGLNCLSVGLSRAFAPHVRVNVVMPGAFLTDVSTHWDMEEFEQRAKASISLNRAGRPEEIVGAVMYLASAASSYTTGSVIKVDGGATASPA